MRLMVGKESGPFEASKYFWRRGGLYLLPEHQIAMVGGDASCTYVVDRGAVQMGRSMVFPLSTAVDCRALWSWADKGGLDLLAQIAAGFRVVSDWAGKTGEFSPGLAPVEQAINEGLAALPVYVTACHHFGGWEGLTAAFTACRERKIGGPSVPRVLVDDARKGGVRLVYQEVWQECRSAGLIP